MTEQEWLTCDDPHRMLKWATGHAGHNAPPSDRKLRLFACAWWRSFVPHSPSAERLVFEVEEHGHSGTDKDCWDAKRLLDDCRRMVRQGWSDVQERTEEGTHILRDIVGNPFRPVQRWQPHEHALSRDWWLRQIGTLAHGAYSERNPDGSLDLIRLAILADALEEAGCATHRHRVRVLVYGRPGGHAWDVVVRSDDDNEVLHTASRLTDVARWAEAYLAARNWHRWPSPQLVPGVFERGPVLAADGSSPEVPHPLLVHLRSNGPHVRGCWALDLVLGKE